jgi:hypothetical protein
VEAARPRSRAPCRARPTAPTASSACFLWCIVEGARQPVPGAYRARTTFRTPPGPSLGVVCHHVARWSPLRRMMALGLGQRRVADRGWPSTMRHQPSRRSTRPIASAAASDGRCRQPTLMAGASRRSTPATNSERQPAVARRREGGMGDAMGGEGRWPRLSPRPATDGAGPAPLRRRRPFRLRPDRVVLDRLREGSFDCSDLCEQLEVARFQSGASRQGE